MDISEWLLKYEREEYLSDMHEGLFYVIGYE